MKFSLKQKEIKLDIEGLDGVERKYTLREITGVERDDYMRIVSSKMRYDDKGKPLGVKDMAGLMPALIHLSLFDENNARLDVKDINKFPSEMQIQIYLEAQKLSGLQEDSKAAGNG